MAGRCWTSDASVVVGDVDRNSKVLERRLYDEGAVPESAVGEVVGEDRNAVGVVVTQEEGFRQGNPKCSGLEVAGLKRDGRIDVLEEQNHLDCSCREVAGEGAVV